jgi:hypothetical protein
VVVAVGAGEDGGQGDGEGGHRGGGGGGRARAGAGGSGPGALPAEAGPAAGAPADDWGTRKPPRCPACDAFPDHYREIWTGHGITFAADEKGRPAREGILFEGNPYKVIAVCRCGKRWKLRGVKQIVELQQQPEG